MQKQTSLLNFFNKTPSKEIKDKVKKPDEMQPEVTGSAQLSTDSSQKVVNIKPEPMENNDEYNPPTFKRMKKVKIQDDEDDEAYPSQTPTKSANQTPILSTASTSTASSPLDQFKNLAKSKRNKMVEEQPISQKLKPQPKESVKKSKKDDDDFIADDDEDLEKPSPKKKAAPKRQNSTASNSKGGSNIGQGSPEKDGDGIIDIEKEEGNAFDYRDFSDATPLWARKENCRDANKKRPDDSGYDPTTLYIPPQALEELTPTMKQYWQLKARNFDKIILFKLGTFYEQFYDDALICQKELDFNWMGDKMTVGFPEKALNKFAYELVSRGYKVCVVEQTETPKEMQARLKVTAGKKEKTVKREASQIMSKGTVVDINDPHGEPKYLLSVRTKNKIVGVTFLEVGSNMITLGAFTDDENYTIFKMLISQLRPQEVIYETLETDANIIKIMKNSYNAPVFSPLNDAKLWSQIILNGELTSFFGPKEKWPDHLAFSMDHPEQSKDLIYACFAGLISYLTKMLIAENVLATSRFEKYDPVTFSKKRMVLDSQALQHLEILEVGLSSKNPYDGSLLSFVDKTVTRYGKRLLRKWVCGPLLQVNAINERLDVIEELEAIQEKRGKFRNKIAKLPDFERMCGRFYNLSVKKQVKVILVEEIGVVRLREFKKLLESFKIAQDIATELSENGLQSHLLRSLTTFEDYQLTMNGQSSNMPDITPLIEELQNFISWEGPQKDLPVPKEGIDGDYDALKQEIKVIDDEMTQYLKEIQTKYFNNNKSVCFAHTKHRYEIEVPDELVSGKKKPAEFEFSSRKQGRERFVTPKIKQRVEHLEEIEDKLKQSLNIFTCFLFSHFHKHYKVWDKFCDGLAQLDCLCSLSLTSFLSDGLMCRPEIHPPNQRVFLEVREMRHPCICMTKSNFVPNDILIGDVQNDGNNKNIILLTGPNMGGKSTILRQACIAAVMAQIGCYVPAKECKLSVVDRIFTRIGASDKLMEGKSTFYIEMEETLNILNYGSVNSLSIVDELGRGTSTFDGVSIAYSVLRYLLTELKCRTLFATHYHVLLDEFRDYSDVSYYHMASKIDHEHERVVFLYKLIQGECSNSFGLNIARLTGIPKDTMKSAKEKADEFEKKLNIREYVRVNKAFEKTIDLLDETDNGSVGKILSQIEEALNQMTING